MKIASDTDTTKIRIIATWSVDVQTGPADVTRDMHTKSFSQDATLREVFQWWQSKVEKIYGNNTKYIDNAPLTITVDESTVNEYKEEYTPVCGGISENT